MRRRLSSWQQPTGVRGIRRVGVAVGVGVNRTQTPFAKRLPASAEHVQSLQKVEGPRGLLRQIASIMASAQSGAPVCRSATWQQPYTSGSGLGVGLRRGIGVGVEVRGVMGAGAMRRHR